jgi:hypothetical protein
MSPVKQFPTFKEDDMEDIDEIMNLTGTINTRNINIPNSSISNHRNISFST